jgi:hypothetical protein
MIVFKRIFLILKVFLNMIFICWFEFIFLNIIFICWFEFIFSKPKVLKEVLLIEEVINYICILFIYLFIFKCMYYL